MEAVLVVGGQGQSKFILELLPPNEYAPVITADGGNEARRMLNETDFGLIIINAPLPDEFGQELAGVAARQSMAGVLMFVKNERVDDISRRVASDGVLVVPKPCSRQFFFQALRLAGAARQRLLSLHRENARLQTAIEEIRIVDRAKCALIQCLMMTEPQAHRHIEKQAMDLRLSKLDVAKTILKTYEV